MRQLSQTHSVTGNSESYMVLSRCTPVIDQFSGFIHGLKRDGVLNENAAFPDDPDRSQRGENRSDSNGDGKADLLLQNSTTGQIWMCHMNGSGIIASNRVTVFLWIGVSQIIRRQIVSGASQYPG